MEEIKFEGLVNLSSAENEVLKEYINKKIETEIDKLRQEIANKYYSKRDHDNFLNTILGRRY